MSSRCWTHSRWIGVETNVARERKRKRADWINSIVKTEWNRVQKATRNQKSLNLLPKMVLNLSGEKLAPSYELQIAIDVGNVQALIARDAFELETYYRRVLNLNSNDYTTIPREASCQPASLDTSKFLSRLKTAITSKQCKKHIFQFASEISIPTIWRDSTWHDKFHS